MSRRRQCTVITKAVGNFQITPHFIKSTDIKYGTMKYGTMSSQNNDDDKKKLEIKEKDPYPPFERNLPRMQQRHFVVNRRFTNRPKPNCVKKPQLGSYVYLVSQESFNNRVQVATKLGNHKRALVVGESCFGYNSKHERLLQLLCEESGRRWYVPESEVQVPHFI